MCELCYIIHSYSFKAQANDQWFLSGDLARVGHLFYYSAMNCEYPLLAHLSIVGITLPFHIL